MNTVPKQIQVPQTLDVDAVERALAGLWQQSAEDQQDESDEAMMRARAADLMILLTNEATLEETQQTIRDLALVHPCRALILLADQLGESRDIEMFVSAFCHSEQRSQKAELCCEEITLIARGSFTSELPSAAIPLLVPDLPIFLWWRDLHALDLPAFQALAEAADRLVIDTAELKGLKTNLSLIVQLFDRSERDEIAVSDINWARLTSWRALLANFYDVPEYHSALANLEQVRIEYVGPESPETGVSTQALLIAGWLASRLRWEIVIKSNQPESELKLECSKDGRTFNLSLKSVERPGIKAGRLTQVELLSETGAASFVVKRTDEGLHLETQATLGHRLFPGRTLPVRNRTTAQLLAREIEILGRDTTYEDALRKAAEMVE